MTAFTPEDFRMNLEVKNNISKKQLAERIYGGITYDTALPQQWITWASKLSVLAGDYKDMEFFCQHFVWLYPHGNVMGQPAPLTLEACDVLEQIIEETKNKVLGGVAW